MISIKTGKNSMKNCYKNFNTFRKVINILTKYLDLKILVQNRIIFKNYLIKNNKLGLKYISVQEGKRKG